MKRLGILVLSEPKNGGTFQYSMSMLQALQHLKGWKITIYTSKGNTNFGHFGFDIRSVKAAPLHWPLLVLSAMLGIHGRDPFETEDVVLAPIYSPLLLKTSKPFIFTLHDLQEHYFPDHFSKFQKIWRNLINGVLIKKSAHIICESKHVKDDITKFFKPKGEKISVIISPPLKNTGQFQSIGNCRALAERYQLKPQYLFYPAQFWPHKNHLRLIEAFALIADKFPDIQLVLTGQKRYEYHTVFERVRQLSLTDRVTHLGYVAQEDLPPLFSCATLLVMPSLFESVSIPIYEAFQNNTPVAASNVVALPEQVGDAGLLFNPYSIEDIASSISTLLSNSQLRNDLVERGKLRLTELTPEKYGDKLSDLVDAVESKISIRESSKLKYK